MLLCDMNPATFAPVVLAEASTRAAARSMSYRRSPYTTVLIGASVRRCRMRSAERMCRLRTMSTVGRTRILRSNFWILSWYALTT